MDVIYTLVTENMDEKQREDYDERVFEESREAQESFKFERRQLAYNFGQVTHVAGGA